MDSVKSLLSNRWAWLVVAVLFAFLIYHAPRLAYSLPI